ncbi:MAG TPA: hypothetical protein VMF13_17160, partial [Luteitalea sp.]|nr:hypothetical protein [Luteitalea sp.]
VLVGLTLPIVARAEQTPRRGPQPTGRVVAALGESTWGQRAEAVAALLPRIDAEPTLRTRADLQMRVAALLVQERAALRDARAAGLVVDAARVEHAELLMVVGLRLAPHAGPEARKLLLAALIQGDFAPGSRFATGLAAFGGALVDEMLGLARDEAGSRRASAYTMMGRVLQQHGEGVLDEPLEITQALDLVAALRTGLDDAEVGVRVAAIDGVVLAGDAGATDALGQLARRDMSPMVRSRAREALDALTR